MGSGRASDQQAIEYSRDGIGGRTVGEAAARMIAFVIVPLRRLASLNFASPMEFVIVYSNHYRKLLES